MTATAVRFVAPCRVELGDVAVREPADGELLVRAEFSGISGGTEMLAYRGEIDPELALDETLDALRGTFAYPFSYGYSAVGRVERSRASVPEGARVFAFHAHQDVFVVSERDWSGWDELQSWTDDRVVREAQVRTCPATGTSVWDAWQAEPKSLEKIEKRQRQPSAQVQQGGQLQVA